MPDAVAAEWIKIGSLRSTFALLAAGTVVTVATGVGFCLLVGPEFRRADPADRAAFDPVGLSFAGMQLGQLAVVVLAVLAVGSEFTTGMIRTSLAAVPRRSTFLAAKCAVLTAVGLAWGTITGALSLLAGTWALGAELGSLPVPVLARTVAGAGAYAALISVCAAAVAFLVRRPTAALGILLPALFVVSSMLAASGRLRPLARFLPDRAGLRLMQVHQESGDLTPSVGGLVLLLWTVGATAVAGTVFARRDA
ncbi:ABC transporter permease [Streptomyces sp. SP18CS02]|uniref:ABC transporter permease n=1 Tax=Streptomyces sp. SP18CS02 TaxID=3002531 RepID=UPI002E7A81BF|nr:ABC transporter permease [Streptomyces sp. SP18CS02]MEE1752713.1 ABC transporter permease [Streptomyces sp. SP18CS02]